MSALYVSLLSSKKLSSGFQCPICLKDCEQDDTYNELPCGHKFHPDCIVPWLKKVPTYMLFSK
jgi:hypothetical protein